MKPTMHPNKSFKPMLAMPRRAQWVAPHAFDVPTTLAPAKKACGAIYCALRNLLMCGLVLCAPTLAQGPDRLEKRTFKPKPEAMLVEGGVLTFQRGQQKHTVQLAQYPELTGFIDSIRGTLAGDRKTLERSFRLKLEGQSERWLLTLTPTNPKMATSVHLIRIAGLRDDVRSIEVIQTDGDRSLMNIERMSAR